MYQIIYKKKNGDIIKRTINTYSPYRVGDRTSMGWTVLDIQYNYNGKYYSKVDYEKIINKHYNKERRVFRIKKTIARLYGEIGYPIALMVLIRFLKVL